MTTDLLKDFWVLNIFNRFFIALLLFKHFFFFLNILSSLCKLFTQTFRTISSLIKVEKQIILCVGSRREWVFPDYCRSKPNGSIMKCFHTIKRGMAFTKPTNLAF